MQNYGSYPVTPPKIHEFYPAGRPRWTFILRNASSGWLKLAQQRRVKLAQRYSSSDQTVKTSESSMRLRPSISSLAVVHFTIMSHQSQPLKLIGYCGQTPPVKNHRHVCNKPLTFLSTGLHHLLMSSADHAKNWTRTN